MLILVNSSSGVGLRSSRIARRHLDPFCQAKPSIQGIEQIRLGNWPVDGAREVTGHRIDKGLGNSPCRPTGQPVMDFHQRCIPTGDSLKSEFTSGMLTSQNFNALSILLTAIPILFHQHLVAVLRCFQNCSCKCVAWIIASALNGRLIC
jgi:hypothetical protein